VGAIVEGTKLHVAVIDIGKLQNLGWAIDGPKINCSGSNIDMFIDRLTDALDIGPVALGFEAPMFVPYRTDVAELDRCRVGEGNRPFSAAAGACVLAKGLVICPYILAALKKSCPNAKVTFNWRDTLSTRDLLVFEAFVTHESAGHIGCAKLAMKKFREGMIDPKALKSDISEPRVLNLLGAMLMNTGWSNSIDMLSVECLVIRHQGLH
jgi:hypothetical protein